MSDLQAQFDEGLASVTQAIQDAATRVNASISDLESKIVANGALTDDVQASLEQLKTDAADLAAIDPAATAAPAPAETPAAEPTPSDGTTASPETPPVG